MTKFNRGDIVLVVFPDSNLRTAKRRPALVVQADNLKTGLSQLIVAMITSNLKRAGHASRILVERQTTVGEESGLMTDSVIMTDNLATVRLSQIDRVLGAWSDTAALNAALCHTLEIR
ncbi:MAG: type II toxin-antitoxin system PemK/MazF family toxin [Cyanobacteria bacterium J06626_6]